MRHHIPTTVSGVRDRLLLAFTELRMYGIDAQEDVDGEPAWARAVTVARLRVHAPHGLGSYVFWMRADAGLLDEPAGLPLYTSGPEVDRAVVAALGHHGLAARPGPGTGVLIAG